METLRVRTERRTQLVDVTQDVQRAVGRSGVMEGVCYVYVPHTTAAVMINEHADPDVATDLEGAKLCLSRAESWRWDGGRGCFSASSTGRGRGGWLLR